MVSSVFMFLSLLLIQLSSFEARVHPLHPKTSGKLGIDRRAFGRILGGIDGRNFVRSNGRNKQRTLGGINQRTFGRPLGGIDQTTFWRTLEIPNTRNAELADPVSDNTDPEKTGSAMDLESPPSTCSCNGAIDEIHHGECSKETVWCYVDPSAPCEDSKVWYGGFGHGWSYSHDACEAHLAEVYKDQCKVLSQNKEVLKTTETPNQEVLNTTETPNQEALNTTETLNQEVLNTTETTNQEVFNTTETEDKECSCNGELDSLDMGECRTPWIGRFWCYVDSVGSGCEDAQVWYGEHGFCQTISFLACDGYDNGYDYNYDDNDDDDNADGL